MDIRRHIMGSFGIAFLLGGLGLWLVKGTGNQMAGVGVKVGLVLCAIWLAFPQVAELTKRVPSWLMAAIGISGLVVAARPRMILYLGPVVAAIAFLQFVGWLFKPLPNPKPKSQANAASKNDRSMP
jgi:hypothetical protein